MESIMHAEPVILAVLVSLGLLVMFIPTCVAAGRGHPQLAPIVLINVLLGWTALGWVVALVWSSSAINRRA